MPPLHKRFLYFFDPSLSSVPCKVGDHYVSEQYPSPELSFKGHIFVTSLWLTAVIFYGVFVSYQWFTMPQLSDFQHLSAELYSPVAVKVSVRCSNPPNCGTITVTTNYSDYPRCASKSSEALVNGVSTVSLGTTGGTTTVTLCTVPPPVFSTNTKLPLQLPGVTIDMSSVNPGIDKSIIPTGVPAPNLAAYAEVNIYATTKTSISSSFNQILAGDQLLRTVNMNSWQVKSLSFGQTITVKNGQVQTVQPFPLYPRYEGRRPGWRANLLLGLNNVANVASTTDQASPLTAGGIIGLLASIAGCTFIVNTFMPYIVSGVKKVAPGPAEEERRLKERREKERRERESMGTPLTSLNGDCEDDENSGT